MKMKSNNADGSLWRSLTVRSCLPKELKKLEEMSKNIWWSWDYETRHLFHNIDKKLWSITEHNPVEVLSKIDLERLNELSSDKEFMDKVDVCYARFREYVDTKPDTTRPSIAYFSMEYGLSNVLKIYSGGLGVLAGDYLKEASDSNIDMTAVGFMYKYGYFKQTLSMEGQQINNYEAQNFNLSPIEQVTNQDGSPLVLEVPYPERIVYVHIYKVAVGRIPLYLMDTDIDMNSEWDRSITHSLYGGDWENRMKQEYLLGIGGILMLNKLGIKKDIYHCNEGHAALINIQRLVDYIQNEKLSFFEALEVVRSSSLYTVHTPVPAGHDSFDEGLFGKYMSSFPEKLNISWTDLMDLGRENPGTDEKFSMSVFACNTCQEVNGVSKLHGWVSQKMFAPIWKGYFPEELHVGYVTNGVHMPTWAASEWQEFYKKHFEEGFFTDQSNQKRWEAIYNVDDLEIWNLRKLMKNRLIEYIKNEFTTQWLKNQGDPSRVISIVEQINPNALIIGFARRFATYKRAHLLFSDLDRLARIVNNPDRPVQFIFAGKAHPADGGGQGLIKHIVEISRRPEFLGKIIFLENYDMRLAKRLVSGVDIWLNTPTRPLEASGTSGEKAEMNGVLNLSVLDGWWYEGYRKGAGWALTDKRTYENQHHQDQLDAATIYAMLEQEIVPMYYAKNSKGYSPEWIQTVKNSIAQIAPHYTMKRMIDDYVDRFYSKEAERKKMIVADNYAKAKELAAWKKTVGEKWDSIEVKSLNMSEEIQNFSFVGETYNVEVILDVKGLGDSIGVELVILDEVDGVTTFSKALELELVSIDNSIARYTFSDVLKVSGSHRFSFRMFPKHKDLPHRMDFCYVRWF
ncbi:glycosyltransferase family 1 protein [Porphyromonadaceae bacterium]